MEGLPLHAAAFLQRSCCSQNTKGDGACAMHAAFGFANAQLQLELVDARAAAVTALKEALAERVHDSDVAAVGAAWWGGLALPACRAEDAAEEAKVFGQIAKTSSGCSKHV